MNLEAVPSSKDFDFPLKTLASGGFLRMIEFALEGSRLFLGAFFFSEYNAESLHHLFIQSEVTISIWKCFGHIFRMPYVYLSIPNAIALWMNTHTRRRLLLMFITCSFNQKFDMCKAAIAAYVLKEVWNSRCRALFQEKKMNARRIAMRVLNQIQLTTFLYSPKKLNSKMKDHVLGIMGIPTRQPKIKRGVWCRWNFPQSGYYKLNFDGSAKDNISAGGGIIQNSNGNFLAAFSAYYGHGNHNEAEFRALQDGLVGTWVSIIWWLKVTLC